MDKPSCKTCVFFKPEVFDEHSGHCRRNPPAVFTTQYRERDRASDDRETTSYSSFVSVRAEELCGEYRRAGEGGLDASWLSWLGNSFYLLAVASWFCGWLYVLEGMVDQSWSPLLTGLVLLLVGERFTEKSKSA